ncbi:hypothetical protein AB0I54_36260 [Streptomyces sp. NPDC050625]|uniref:hypothetical protein n=1 Tax=Streptomyces sp. NPDC050625 TaxID=3154629 RepID=UPI003418A8B8
MTKNLPGTARASARLLLVTTAAGSLLLTACGSQGSQNTGSSSAPPSAAVSRQTKPHATAAPKPSGTDGALSKAAQEAAAQRAAGAPSGDPVHPTNTAIPSPEGYGFGKATATAAHGEVLAYTPRRQSGRVVVPLTIHNASDKRVDYTVTVTVVGGKSPLSVTVKAGNVWPGTTVPSEADVTASGSTAGSSPLKISLKVVRDYPFGDAG